MKNAPGSRTGLQKLYTKACKKGITPITPPLKNNVFVNKKHGNVTILLFKVLLILRYSYNKISLNLITLLTN